MSRELGETEPSVGRCRPIRNYKKNCKKKKKDKILNFPLEKKNMEDCWDIDKQKILSSLAFWRLQNKTQIYVPADNVHYQTRMTHTLLVNEIARKIVEKLNINENFANESLTEAIALGHDLGHTPFGHAGEEALNELMKRNGDIKDHGFSHNVQSARVVLYIEWDNLLERKDVGMGLTWEVVSGIILHTIKDRRKYKDELECKIFNNIEECKIEWSNESRIVFFADEIAQRALDIEDGLRYGIIEKDVLEDIWREYKIGKGYPNYDPDKPLRYDPNYPLKFKLIKKYIDDVIDDTINKKYNYFIKEEPKKHPEKDDSYFFNDINELDKKLFDLITRDIHKNSNVKNMNAWGRYIIKTLFNTYLIKWNDWESDKLGKEIDYILSENVRENEDCFGLSKPRVIANYIAAMNDQYAENQYNKLKNMGVLEI